MKATQENDYRHSPKSSRVALARFAEVVFPLLLFVLALVPRIDYLVARSTTWHARAGRFIEAVLSGDWENTLLAPHPGVTTMWLAGIANRAGRLIIPDFERLPLDQQMTVELVPLAVVISLAIVLAYFLLARIFGRLAAAVVALLLALDPFHISISKTLHVDALMGVFVMISALLILVYIRARRAGPQALHPVLSGIFAGLALLSKTPALFLIPFFLLCLATWKLSDLVAIESGPKLILCRKGRLVRIGKRVGRPAFCFGQERLPSPSLPSGLRCGCSPPSPWPIPLAKRCDSLPRPIQALSSSWDRQRKRIPGLCFIRSCC